MNIVKPQLNQVVHVHFGESLVNQKFLWGQIFEPLASTLCEILDSENFGALSSVNGEFALISVNRVSHQILVLRDPMGVCPLYYEQDKEDWYFSRSLKSLLKRKQRRLDAKVCERFMYDLYDWDENFLIEGIKRAPAGGLLVVSNSSIRKISYWPAIKNQSQSMSESEKIEEVTKALKSAVNVRNQVDSALFWSGGIDSTAIAHMLSKAKLETKCYLISLEFSQGLAKNDEMLNELSKKFDLDSVRVSGDSLENLIGYNEIFRDNPLFYDPNFSLFVPLLEEAQRLGARRVMTGVGGDDLWTPNEGYKSDLLFSKKFKLVIGKLMQASGVRQLIGPHLPSAVNQYVLVIQNLFKSSRDRKMALIRFKARQKRRQIRSSTLMQNQIWRLHLSGMYQFGFEQEQELASLFNIEMSYPLLDRRVIEAMFNFSSSDFLAMKIPKQPLVLGAFESVDISRLLNWYQGYEDLRKQILDSSSLRERLSLEEVKDEDKMREIRLKENFLTSLSKQGT